MKFSGKPNFSQKLVTINRNPGGRFESCFYGQKVLIMFLF